jgi:type I restriction enzyme S subunit
LDAEFAKIDAVKAGAEKSLQHAIDLFQAALKKELTPKEGWKMKKLGEVCTLSQGLAINAQTRHLIVEKSALPLLRIKDLKENSREIFVDEVKCPESCRVFPDEIIYTRTGTLGLVFTGFYGVMHNNCFKVILDKSLVTKMYIIHYLQSSQFKNNIISLAKRAAQPDITHKLFKEQSIPLPPLPEQEQIVARLDTLSANCKTLQANYERTIALCDDMKQALLRKAFNGEL